MPALSGGAVTHSTAIVPRHWPTRSERDSTAERTASGLVRRVPRPRPPGTEGRVEPGPEVERFLTSLAGRKPPGRDGTGR